MEKLLYLTGLPWKIDENIFPRVTVDGKTYSIEDLTEKCIKGKRAKVAGANEKNIELICSSIDVITLSFYNMRVKNPLSIDKLKRLKNLAIDWNTKIDSLDFLKNLDLEMLVLVDTPKINSIELLKDQQNLLYLEFSGGIYNKNCIDSLEPSSELKNLEHLVLSNLKIIDNGLKPLANCQGLQTLDVSNQFKTEEYAYLKAKCPDLECDMLNPYIKLSEKISDITENDIMVVGSRKPFLNSIKDKEKIEKYKVQFEDLVKKFS